MPQLEFAFEREAMHGEPMPSRMPLYEQAAYEAMANLYARYKRGEIDRESASREKKIIKYVYEERKRIEEYERELAVHWQKIVKSTEMYNAMYRKAETPEEALAAADKLVQAIDNAVVRHKWEGAICGGK